MTNFTPINQTGKGGIPYRFRGIDNSDASGAVESKISSIICKLVSPPLILITFIAIPRLLKVLPAFLNAKPTSRPQNFPDGQGGWPLYFAPLAFGYNRSFGALFVIGLIVDVFIRLLLPAFWR